MICAHVFEIDEVTMFINFCLFSAYLGTYKWSVVLPSNVTDLKYAQWLKSPWPFKKWTVKVTHPTPLCLCMHGILVIRTITWLYRLCRIYYLPSFTPCQSVSLLSDNLTLLSRSVLVNSARAWMNFHVIIPHFVFFSNMSDFKKILKVITCANKL